MDAFARGLVVADRIIGDGAFDAFVKERYASFDAGIGKKVEEGKATLADLEAYVLENGEPHPRSGGQEKLENMLNQYIFA